MLPIGVSAPPHGRPYLTWGLALLLVAVFVHVQLLRDGPPAAYCSDLSESAAAVRRAAGTVPGFVCRYGAIPNEISEGRRLGTLLTSVLVHAGWFHLTANLLFLLAFAPRVEADLGRAGLLALFAGSGVLAGAAHAALVPLLVAPTIGASGAVAGVLGAHLVLAPRARLRVLVGPVPVRLPTWFVLTVWAALQVGYTALVLRLAEYPVGVAYESHVVGFAVGMLCVAGALRVRPDLRGWGPQR